MFIGHYAAGLALRRADSSIPLWLLLLAACWVDMVFSVLLLVGVEHVRIVPGITAANPLDLYDYPYSHGLLAALIWSGIAYAIFLFSSIRRSENKARAALILALAVFSHWILDLISHIPDLPLVSNDSLKVGLGLWKSIPATLILESLLFIGGFYLFLKSTNSGTFKGNTRITIMAAALLILNYFSTGGELPPNVEMLGFVNLIGGVSIIALAGWLGMEKKNRNPKD